MISLSYTIHDQLAAKLRRIDEMRCTALSIPLSPSTEQQIRWDMRVWHIYGSLLLTGVPITREEVAAILTSPRTGTANTVLSVRAYHNALLWITQHWTGNPHVLTEGDIAVLAVLGLSQPQRTHAAYTKTERDIRAVCRHLSVQREHPVIAAGILHGFLLTAPITDTDNGRVARLVHTLLLTQAGYDLRGFLAQETAWIADTDAYVYAASQLSKPGQMTPWLEYIVGTYETCLTQRNTDLTRAHAGTLTSTGDMQYATLTRRQETILSLFLRPNTMLSNKDIRRALSISAATASRDLTKLVHLGILLTHGKGRTVTYLRLR